MRFARPMLGLVILALVASGCTSYYRITDTHSGRTYYTTSFTRDPNNVRFKDEHGQEVAVPAVSRVDAISADEYRTATRR